MENRIKLVFIVCLLLGRAIISNSQTIENKSDTFFVELKTFKYIQGYKFRYRGYKDKTIYLYKKKGINSQFDYTLIDRLHGDVYCIFKTKNGKQIEEGYWVYEYFRGYYICYHKNGKIKAEGNLDGSKIGKWYYYDKSGKFIKEENYSDDNKLIGNDKHFNIISKRIN